MQNPIFYKRLLCVYCGFTVRLLCVYCTVVYNYCFGDPETSGKTRKLRTSRNTSLPYGQHHPYADGWCAWRHPSDFLDRQHGVMYYTRTRVLKSIHLLGLPPQSLESCWHNFDCGDVAPTHGGATVMLSSTKIGRLQTEDGRNFASLKPAFRVRYAKVFACTIELAT